MATRLNRSVRAHATCWSEITIAKYLGGVQPDSPASGCTPLGQTLTYPHLGFPIFICSLYTYTAYCDVQNAPEACNQPTRYLAARLWGEMEATRPRAGVQT